ncbi:hypothetical protein HPB50_014138 [Hyalomma asiaticum]|uniref:Uncharacterized protein n=1 Tax=Hyalomma asiaticum TaxID=266040 RepID=A0ACB7SGZ4_HYAAI|nr:hypothetical protein HPB50_014138 [Hyalomma asiaticum]
MHQYSCTGHRATPGEEGWPPEAAATATAAAASMVSEQTEVTPPENLSENSADSKVQSCSNGDICRICFCGVSTESLLAPCKCKGKRYFSLWIRVDASAATELSG